jgi:RNA polymerase sigma-70 factor (ECF subfamily)
MGAAQADPEPLSRDDLRVPPNGCCLDPDSRHWVEQLAVGHPRRDRTVGELHELLRRAASHELSRRRSWPGAFSGPEYDDLVQQAADDALVKILARLDDFQELSRFTTWAYKFVIFEISGKVARHAWRRQPPGVDDFPDERFAAPAARRPEAWLEQQGQLHALSEAIGELTERQREVFVAVALNDVPIDILAAKLDTNRNAVYKNLFDARRSLRAKLSAAGHPVSEGSAAEVSADARHAIPAGSRSG